MIQNRDDPPGKIVSGPDGVPKSIFRYMKDTGTIYGDIVSPSGERWSAESGEEDYLYAGSRPCEDHQ